MKLRIIEKEQEFKEVRDIWDELVCRSKTSTPFQLWGWSYYWWKHLKGDKALKIILVEDTVGELVAISPTCIESYEGLAVMKIIGTRGTDYLDIISDKDDYGKATTGIIDWFVENRNISIIHIEDIPDKSPIFIYLPGLIKKHNLVWEKELLCQTMKIDLEGGWGKYLDNLSNKKKKEIAYDRRYIDKKAGKISYKKSGAADFDIHVKHHQERQSNAGNQGSYFREETVSFMTDVASYFDKKGILDLSFLLVEEKKVASTYGAVLNNKKFLITVGFDPTLEKFSVGSVLYGIDIEDAINRELGLYDLSRGDEKYKRSWGARSEANYRVVISKSSADMHKFKKAYSSATVGLDFAPSSSS